MLPTRRCGKGVLDLLAHYPSMQRPLNMATVLSKNIFAILLTSIHSFLVII